MSESYENPSGRYHRSNLHEQSEGPRITSSRCVRNLTTQPRLVGIQSRPFFRLCNRGLFILFPVLCHVVG